jgi:hypothetical protein
MTNALRRPLLMTVGLVLLLAFGVPRAHASTLLGTTAIEATSDSLAGTSSEAFKYEAVAAGTATAINIYLTTTTGAKVALYSEGKSKPATLLGSGETSSNTAKSWVTIALSKSVGISKATSYWIAVEPVKGGKVGFRDHVSGATDYEGVGLANPWSGSTTFTDGPMSAYVTGEEAKEETKKEGTKEGTKEATKFTCPAGSLTPNGEGLIEVTTSEKLVCGQTAKEIIISPGVDGTLIEHNLISGGGEGIAAGGVNCSVPNGPVYEGCESQPAFTNTVIKYNNIVGPFSEDAIHTSNFKKLTIERNWLHGFEETGNHTDGWQNVWGGEEATFAHNVVSDFVGEGTILKDGDVTKVRYNDNLILESGVDKTLPEGDAELQLYGVHTIELMHNTYANNIPKGEAVRVGTTGLTAMYNVFDNIEVFEGATITESQNNLDEEPWSFFDSPTDSIGVPTFNAGWQTTKKSPDGTTLGIDFPASEVEEEAGLPH